MNLIKERLRSFCITDDLLRHTVDDAAAHIEAQERRIAELCDHLDTANAALHATLSQQAQNAAQAGQEPKAWMVNAYGRVDKLIVREDVANEYADKRIADGAENVEVRPLYATPPAPANAIDAGLSRDALHDKAWALYHAKTFDDTQLAKVNIHTIRTVFNVVYDAMKAAK
jgi:hypothetical protein